MNEETIEGLKGYELFKRRELSQPHTSYAKEKERLRVIEQGNIEESKKLPLVSADGSTGTLSPNELRNNKNLLIAAITEYTRAAIRGGLSEETAFAMSDSYIQNNEFCSSVVEIEKLHHHAFRAFTHAVHDQGLKHYSPKITRCLNYIAVHLHDSITLEDAGEAIGLSPCHLSRLFRSEVGMSFVECIQYERIEAAKHMLIYSDFKLSAISEYLHFSSQSYFVKVFRKFEGCTPGDYRNMYT